MFTVTNANVTHAEEIHAIELTSFSDPWSTTSISEEIERKHSVCLVAMDENGNIVGHVSMRHIINEGHISNIAVLPEHRRMGIAALLLSTLVEKAIGMDIIGLTLEVRVSNSPALSLYEKFGFVVEGYRKNYYSHPNEDAAIMWKHFD